MTLWLAPLMVANILITVAMLRGLMRTGRARIQNESVSVSGPGLASAFTASRPSVMLHYSLL